MNFNQIACSVFYLAKNLQTILNFQQHEVVVSAFYPYFSLPFHMIISLGVSSCGGSFSFVDIFQSLKVLNQQIIKLNSRILFIHPSYLIKGILDGTKIKHVILVEKDIERTRIDKSKWPGKNFHDLNTFLRKPKDLLPISIKFNNVTDTCCLPFNDFNKCIKFTHGNIISNLIQLDKFGEFSNNDVVLLNYPFFHTFSLIILFYCVRKGIKIITLDEFEMNSFLQCVNSNRVTKCFLHIKNVLKLYEISLGSSNFFDQTTVKSITCLGDTVSSVIQKEMFVRLQNIDIKNCYGSWETQFISLQKDRLSYKDLYHGQLLPHISCKILDENNNEVQFGKDGDIAVRSSSLGHYYGEKQYLWYKTGDVGRLDSDNYLYIVDKIVNKFLIDGVTFYTNEIRDILLTHEDIIDAVVIIHNLEPEVELVGFVVAKGKSEITEEMLIKYSEDEIRVSQHIKQNEMNIKKEIENKMQKDINEKEEKKKKIEEERVKKSRKTLPPRRLLPFPKHFMEDMFQEKKKKAQSMVKRRPVKTLPLTPNEKDFYSQIDDFISEKLDNIAMIQQRKKTTPTTSEIEASEIEAINRMRKSLEEAKKLVDSEKITKKEKKEETSEEKQKDETKEKKVEEKKSEKQDVKTEEKKVEKKEIVISKEKQDVKTDEKKVEDKKNIKSEEKQNVKLEEKDDVKSKVKENVETGESKNIKSEEEENDKTEKKEKVEIKKKWKPVFKRIFFLVKLPRRMSGFMKLNKLELLYHYLINK